MFASGELSGDGESIRDQARVVWPPGYWTEIAPDASTVYVAWSPLTRRRTTFAELVPDGT
jgi:hypothetical protein